MTGSLLTLAANKTGELDKNITGNPSITFFKNVYKQHTNFAKEIIKIYFSESNVKLGSTHNCKIPHKGTLLSKLYLYVELPSLTLSGSQSSTETSNIIDQSGNQSSDTSRNTQQCRRCPCHRPSNSSATDRHGSQPLPGQADTRWWLGIQECPGSSARFIDRRRTGEPGPLRKDPPVCRGELPHLSQALLATRVLQTPLARPTLQLSLSA